MTFDDYWYSLDITDDVSALAPAAQYTAWCNALGVSATVPLQTLDGDDLRFSLDLGSAPTPDGILKALYSDEGVLSYYSRAPDPADPDIGSDALEGPSASYPVRRAFVAKPCRLAFAFSTSPAVPIDTETTAGMFQRSGAVSLWKGTTKTLGAATNRVNFAVRQEGTTTIIVMQPVDVATPLAIHTGAAPGMRLATSVAVARSALRAITVVVSPSASARPTVTPRRSGFVERVPVVPTADHARTKGPRRSGRAGPSPVDGLGSMLGLGRGRISGTVAEDTDPIDTPLKRVVRLIRDQDGMVIAQQWSDATTGAYEFNYVDELYRYTVISYDYLKNFRAVVADNLTPDLIELP